MVINFEKLNRIKSGIIFYENIIGESDGKTHGKLNKDNCNNVRMKKR